MTSLQICCTEAARLTHCNRLRGLPSGPTPRTGRPATISRRFIPKLYTSATRKCSDPQAWLSSNDEDEADAGKRNDQHQRNGRQGGAATHHQMLHAWFQM
jgi:hypothetical protein